MTASTLLQRLVLLIVCGTVQTGIGKVDPARKLRCTTAAHEQHQIRIRFVVVFLFHSFKVISVNRQYIFLQSKAIKDSKKKGNYENDVNELISEDPLNHFGPIPHAHGAFLGWVLGKV